MCIRNFIPVLEWQYRCFSNGNSQMLLTFEVWLYRKMFIPKSKVPLPEISIFYSVFVFSFCFMFWKFIRKYYLFSYDHHTSPFSPFFSLCFPISVCLAAYFSAVVPFRFPPFFAFPYYLLSISFLATFAFAFPFTFSHSLFCLYNILFLSPP